MHWTPWRPVEPAPVDPAPWADTGDARRILFGGHAMRDEGTDSTAHFSVCGNPESWSTAPGPDFIEHQLAHAVRESQRPGLQPDGVPVRTQGNDAGLGRLAIREDRVYQLVH